MKNNAAGFEPTVASLLNYECPEWFRDAKFGIYLHWGVYSVAERGEWYPREMYIEGDAVYLHHCQTYGHPSTFGYKDFVDRWKAERWDPDAMVDLFRRAGAKYFTPCAIHHDNFDLWNSRHHRWNSVNMGPKKDITGIWRDAALRAGLRFGCTTHLERTWSWLQTNKGCDRSGPLKGVPYDGNDPAYRDFYLDPCPDVDARHPRNAPPAWRRHWADRIKDLIDNYHPDYLFFDGGVPFLGDDRCRTGLDVIAHLYNHSLERHDGRQEAVMTVKDQADHGRYFPGICTLDYEHGRADAISPQPWQTDTSLGPWGYHALKHYQPAGNVIHLLVDIVSKNGNLLLNVPPRADGTLDPIAEEQLRLIGRWLDVNGEAIYGTRPWLKHGEGRLRYTRKGNAAYIILLDWPGNGLIDTWDFAGDLGLGRIADVTMLGHDGELRWGQAGSSSDSSLRIQLPETKPCDYAWTLRVRFEGGRGGG